MHDIHIDILVQAPPEMVWAKLTDFRSYPGWNPLLRVEAGEAREGSSLLNRYTVPGLPAIILRPRVRIADPPRHIAWEASLLFPGIIDSVHGFRMKRKDGSHTLLDHYLRLSGLFASLFVRSFDANLRRGLEGMNMAIKDKVEDDVINRRSSARNVTTSTR